jgi:uncharacterized membrane protein YidH (DUF202 family)
MSRSSFEQYTLGWFTGGSHNQIHAACLNRQERLKRNPHVPNSSPQTNWSVVVVVVLVLVVLVVVVVVVLVVGGPPFPRPKHKSRAPGS